MGGVQAPLRRRWRPAHPRHLHGASRTLNPSLPQRVVDRALEKDRTRATAEYLAEFRTDVEGFVALEVVESCVGDHREMLPAAGVTYRAFVDPSGGSEDAMTLAIAHKTTTPDERVIVDAVREVRPPFSPSAVVDDFAVLLKSYRVSKVVGDHYGGEFVKEPFRKNGISYELCKQPKSDLFRDMLPLLNSGHISLPRHDRLIAQIVGLERRVSRAGRGSIDHAPGAHDDIANAVSGVVGAIASGVGRMKSYLGQLMKVVTSEGFTCRFPNSYLCGAGFGTPIQKLVYRFDRRVAIRR